MSLGLGYNASPMMAANPPYIVFETRAVEKRKTAAEGAAVFYVDTDFALVTSHGSKDTTEKIATEWFDYLKEQVRQQRFPREWYDHFLRSYKAWKADQEPPVLGTSILNWPAASPAEIKLLKSLGIRAVEDLATANVELINRLGMGGQSLCNRAKDWVVGKTDTAPLVQQVDAMRQSQAGMELQIRNLLAANDQLRARLDQKEAAAAPPLASLDDRLSAAKDAAGGMSDADAVDDALKE